MIRTKVIGAGFARATLGIAVRGTPAAAYGLIGQKFARRAKIAIAEARAVALKAFL